MSYEVNPQTGVARGFLPGRNVRSKCRCSCPAVYTTTRILLRSSSTHEPSDPPLRVGFCVYGTQNAQLAYKLQLSSQQVISCFSKMLQRSLSFSHCQKARQSKRLPSALHSSIQTHFSSSHSLVNTWPLVINPNASCYCNYSTFTAS